MRDSNKSTIIELISWGRTRLDQAGVRNFQKEAEILLAFCIGVSFPDLLTRLQECVSSPIQKYFAELIEKRCAQVPLQYLTGSQEFMSLEFKVNESVLIPRWDTERLVELTLNQMRDFAYPLVVDVGTGSGVIAVSLAKYCRQSKVLATDISSDALEIAIWNAQRHYVGDRITFLKGNFLDPIIENFLGLKERGVHIVVSNPPYICTGEMEKLPRDVQKEPQIALNGGADGLKCYREILAQAGKVLLFGGYIFLEIGYNQAEEVDNLCQENGFSHIKIFQDWEGRDRVITGRYQR